MHLKNIYNNSAYSKYSHFTSSEKTEIHKDIYVYVNDE